MLAFTKGYGIIDIKYWFIMETPRPYINESPKKPLGALLVEGVELATAALFAAGLTDLVEKVLPPSAASAVPAPTTAEQELASEIAKLRTAGLSDTEILRSFAGSHPDVNKDPAARHKFAGVTAILNPITPVQ